MDVLLELRQVSPARTGTVPWTVTRPVVDKGGVRAVEENETLEQAVTVRERLQVLDFYVHNPHSTVPPLSLYTESGFIPSEEILRILWDLRRLLRTNLWGLLRTTQDGPQWFRRLDRRRNLLGL